MITSALAPLIKSSNIWKDQNTSQQLSNACRSSQNCFYLEKTNEILGNSEPSGFCKNKEIFSLLGFGKPLIYRRKVYLQKRSHTDFVMEVARGNRNLGWSYVLHSLWQSSRLLENVSWLNIKTTSITGWNPTILLNKRTCLQINSVWRSTV